MEFQLWGLTRHILSALEENWIHLYDLEGVTIAVLQNKLVV